MKSESCPASNDVPNLLVCRVVGDPVNAAHPFFPFFQTSKGKRGGANPHSTLRVSGLNYHQTKSFLSGKFTSTIMLEHLQPLPPDPILGLMDAYRRDERSEKINLGVGVYQDERGETPVLESVKNAERRLWETERSKTYLAIAGVPEFGDQVQRLLLGADDRAIQQQRVTTLQAPGGTGALRIAADFIARTFPTATVWLSQPTWENHPKIFDAARVPTSTYRYFDPATQEIDFTGLLLDVERMAAGDVMLLHGCCHNPTGAELNSAQWSELADALQKRRVLPLIDFAYQGFGAGLEEDAVGVRAMCRVHAEVLIASSYSKIFGLYRERVGALSAIAATSQQAATVASHLRACVRTAYSNPPAHGGAIVAAVLADATLSAQWRRELDAMRTRIQAMRDLFATTIARISGKNDFDFVRRQQGMFSILGISPTQVDQLREEEGIYMVRSGRVNFAGFTPTNVERFCRALV